MTCHFCDTDGRRHANAAHWTGTEYIRIDVCGDCRDRIASAPRRPRRPKRQPQLAGEWAMVGAMLTGKSFDELS